MEVLFVILGGLILILVAMAGAVKGKKAAVKAKFKKAFGIGPYSIEQNLVRRGIELVLDEVQNEISALDKELEEKRANGYQATVDDIRQLDKELAGLKKRRDFFSRSMVEKKKLASSFGHEQVVKNWQNKMKPLQY